jgi:hypothetical protein
MRIYVASSWRTPHHPVVVTTLRQEGYTVYDVRHPVPGDNGFHWSVIDPAWQTWTSAQDRDALHHPFAEEAFTHHQMALHIADATVLVVPCGRSAHLALGYAAGQGQRTAVLMLEPTQPELMYKLCDRICLSMAELLSWLHTMSQHRGGL